MSEGKARTGKLAFIGAGNMAEALVNGLVKGGVCAAESITVTDVRPERLEHLKKSFGVKAGSDNAAAAKDADIVVLAVKPQNIGEAVGQLRDGLDRGRTLVLSLAAGITTSRIEGLLGEGTRVVRAMPNTPALVGAGAAAICAGRWARREDLAAAEALLEAVGIVVRVREEDMDAVTALSGSGPAYVFFLLEAMFEAARQLGQDESTARQLALATVEGAARLCAETGAAPRELRERVTSKGGTTAAALAVLREKGVFDAWVEAIKAAERRSSELSKE